MNTVEQLIDIQSELSDLVSKAERSMRDCPTHVQSCAYWIPQLKRAIGPSMNGEATLSSIIGELKDGGWLD